MKIGFVTGNAGKFKEISGKVRGRGVELEKVDADFIEIQADTLEEVVVVGMDLLDRELTDSQWLMKDDSGLFIDHLGGFPGVYSAYVQKTIGNEGILELMKGAESRSACFRTVIGLSIPGEGVSLFRGECRGTISNEKRGRQGFGYDPVFIPEGFGETFAQMSLKEKNSISHRSEALEKMMSFLGENYK